MIWWLWRLLAPFRQRVDLRVRMLPSAEVALAIARRREGVRR